MSQSTQALSTHVYPGAWVFVTREVLRASTTNRQFEKRVQKVKGGLIDFSVYLENNRESSFIETKMKAIAEKISWGDYTPWAEIEVKPLLAGESHFDVTTIEMVFSILKNI